MANKIQEVFPVEAPSMEIMEGLNLGSTGYGNSNTNGASSFSSYASVRKDTSNRGLDSNSFGTAFIAAVPSSGLSSGDNFISGGYGSVSGGSSTFLPNNQPGGNGNNGYSGMVVKSYRHTFQVVNQEVIQTICTMEMVVKYYNTLSNSS